jgi:cytoskeletal protein RodZ
MHPRHRGQKLLPLILTKFQLIGVVPALCRVLANAGNTQGAQVTTLFGTPEVRPKRKYSLLPLLVVAFLMSYGLMTLLIVKQGTTIESQRTTIRQLLTDSRQVTAFKSKQAETQSQASAPEVASAPTPAQTDDAEKSSPVPAPSTQAVPSEKASKAHSGAKAKRPLPEKPPTPASDIADERRSLMSI